MRKEFSSWIEHFGKTEPRFVFLTGDLGFAALENVESALADRFVNMGVSEQNMISVAAGLAQQGLLPLCYSIAPFAVFRPFEQIRLDLALHHLNVKIVGNGGGYGYGIMGASHHALEDLAVLSGLQSFSCFVPFCNSDVPQVCEAMFIYDGPSYLRLGVGVWMQEYGELPRFSDVRRLLKAHPFSRVTIVGIGPVTLNLFPWIIEKGNADVFVVSRLPILGSSDELLESVRQSGELWVLEEHRARGGLGEYLAALLAQKNVQFRLRHSHAQGYPNGLYGSQAYHQEQSKLDRSSLQEAFDFAS